MSTSTTTAAGVSSDTPAPSSTYDLLIERLRAVAQATAAAATAVNEQRAEVFASAPMTLVETERINTVAASVPRDVVCVGDLLLFGANVPPGLATNRSVPDVFSLHRLVRKAERDWEIVSVPADDPANVLADPSFVRDFGEIYTYYSDAMLRALYRVGDLLLMVFGVGSETSDARVLRWRVQGDTITYIDAYGDHDLPEPAAYDFTWVPVSREHVVEGRWPHVNIADTVFLGGGKGRLEVRIDDVVEGGRTIAVESLAEPEAEVTEARIAHARLGELILIRLAPYREPSERFYVFNRLTRALHRIDAIGRNCHQLPEDQGIVFPGGYHLQNGENKVFATDAEGYEYHASHVSPNGEDLLYVFHRPATGEYLLLPYNLVNRTMATPVACLGYALFADGTMVLSRGGNDAQRVHTVSVFASPFCAPERYQPAVPTDSFHGRIGNAELVRALGETLSLARDAASVQFNAAVFEALVARATRVADGYAWLSEPEAQGLADLLVQLRRVAGDVLDEFASVAAAKKEAHERILDARRKVTDYVTSVELDLRDAPAFIDLLAVGRHLLGHLSGLSGVRHIETSEVDQLAAGVHAAYAALAGRAVQFLAADDSLASFDLELDTISTSGSEATTAAQVDEQTTLLAALGDKAVLLTEVVGGLQVDDPTVVTGVLSRLSDVLARRNSIAASLETRRTSLRNAESAAGFTAAMGVVSQRATASLASASDAPACDHALAALLAELETIELHHGDVPDFAAAIADRRDELAAAFAARRDALAAERTARIDRIETSARRVLGTIVTRSGSLATAEEVEAFFAADPLVASVQRSIAQLRDAGESGRAGELETAVTGARDAARRSVRDRAELFDDGSVKLGRWKVGVNEEPFEVRVARGDDGFEVRLSGTELVVPIPGPLDAFADLAHRTGIGETDTMYRGLFLAFEAYRAGIGADGLRQLATSRLEEGYELGVHDADAAAILAAVAPSLAAGLTASGVARGVAGAWVQSLSARDRDQLRRELTAMAALPAAGASRTHFSSRRSAEWVALAEQAGVAVSPDQVADVLFAHGTEVPVSVEGRDTAERFAEWLRSVGLDARSSGFGELVRWITDATGSSAAVAAEAALVTIAGTVPVLNAVASTVTVNGLRGQHPTVRGGSLTIDVGTAFAESTEYLRHELGRMKAYATARRDVLAHWRNELSVASLRPRVLSSFVRNRLVDEVYLPLVGENLARQLGLAGATQGLLLLVSPPGYGKTSLVEYVADLLGMAMVKINGPALGTGVTSLDPGAAPDAASAAELVKLNRALAMGTNTILYLDDIQHTSPELLQKFIGLCDATRRIEGVIDGTPRTFELAGKRFAVVMAGNPYTSAGAAFRIPDMLANRADVHNLGDVVSGASAAFAQSYVENACSVNEVLAPVLARGRADLEVLLRGAAGEQVRADQLTYDYGATELRQVLDTLRHAVRVRDQLMLVNAAYIASATVDDAMRGEPAFLLQGSYRNMARIAQRLVPAMTASEVDAVVADHYRAESQTLAAAAGWNLAKLRQVLGVATDADLSEIASLRDRWRESNVGHDPLSVMASALRGINDTLEGFRPLPPPTAP